MKIPPSGGRVIRSFRRIYRSILAGTAGENIGSILARWTRRGRSRNLEPVCHTRKTLVCTFDELSFADTFFLRIFLRISFASEMCLRPNEKFSVYKKTIAESSRKKTEQKLSKTRAQTEQKLSKN